MPSPEPGPHKLFDFLHAPSHVQAHFERLLFAQLKIDLAHDLYLYELATDHHPPFIPKNRIPSHQHRVRWNNSWHRRARLTAPAPGESAPYDRLTDPLLEINLREAWPLLTGEDVPGYGRVQCPDPDHLDNWPDCSVTVSHFNCFACSAGGTIIDLGALLYGIEPRGAGFHQVRERLCAAINIDERTT